MYDLLLGGSTLGAKIVKAFGIGPGPARRGAVIRPHLAAVAKARDPHTTLNDRDWLARGPVLVVNGRWVPPVWFEVPDGGGPVAGPLRRRAGLRAGRPRGGRRARRDRRRRLVRGGSPGRGSAREVGGEWIARPWDLVAKNADHLVRDFEADGKVGLSNRHLTTAALVGPVDQLCIHDSARIDPYTVFDTTNGPITVAAGAWVQPFTRVEGPSYIGPGTQLFRANIRGGVTIGPNCRIGGEVEASIVHGHSNKYHEGFLGHAYVGEWVNLGAITSNSDLRNDYGEVYVPIGGDPVATGQAKVGCFLGDHTRTGLGSMLNTGTAIGVMCNVLPAGPLLPKHVPSFTAVLYGRVAPGFPIDQMFATARIVMGRRGRAFSEVEEQLYRDLYEQTRLERERAQEVANATPTAWPVSPHGSDRRPEMGLETVRIRDRYDQMGRWKMPDRAESPTRDPVPSSVRVDHLSSDMTHLIFRKQIPDRLSLLRRIVLIVVGRARLGVAEGLQGLLTLQPSAQNPKLAEKKVLVNWLTSSWWMPDLEVEPLLAVDPAAGRGVGVIHLEVDLGASCRVRSTRCRGGSSGPIGGGRSGSWCRRVSSIARRRRP